MECNTVRPWNPNLRGRLTTADHLIKVGCFEKKVIMFAISKVADIN